MATKPKPILLDWVTLPMHYDTAFRKAVNLLREKILDDGFQIVDEDVSCMGNLMYKIRYK